MVPIPKQSVGNWKGEPAASMDRAPKKNSVKKKVLIAEDHKIMREGLRSLLEDKLGFECVAEANDGYEAVQRTKEFSPDIVIMDITLPNLNGIDATRQIKAQHPETQIVVLSMHATRNYVLQALQAGASAYLLKDAALEELATALASVNKGGMYLSSLITNSAELSYGASNLSAKYLAQDQPLTKRELQVLQLIADGKSTKEIAAALEVSVKTIETHRKQIMDKLGIRSTAGLTKYCIREGLTSL